MPIPQWVYSEVPANQQTAYNLEFNAALIRMFIYKVKHITHVILL